MHYQPTTQLLSNMYMGNWCAHLFPPSTESVQSSSSGGTLTIEWVLKGVIASQGLGTPERFEEMRQRKTEHGETIVTSSTPSTLLPDSTPHSHLQERFWQLLTKIFPPNHTVPIQIIFWLSGMDMRSSSRYTQDIVWDCPNKAAQVACAYQWHVYTCISLIHPITTTQMRKSSINHRILHSLPIIVLELELFFSDSQALWC